MSAAARRVIIMAGGTGGHIFPGLAVADELRASGADVDWLGASGGMESRTVPAHGIPFFEVRIAGLRGKGAAGWIALPFRLARAVRDALRVLREQRPDCAVSFGGYVAGPGGLAARLKGIPLVVHEQNRIPGMTNRVLARFATCVLQAFPDTFPGRRSPVTCGNPVRASVAAIAHPDRRWRERSGRARLLVTGGSQGARVLNRMVPEAMALLGGEMPLVRHQSGEREYEATVKAYERGGCEAHVTPFIDDVAEAYAWADIIVCRAGALTVSELAAAGLGAVLIPYPWAVDDHQTANALFLAQAGAATVVPENEFDAPRLAELLRPLLADRQRTLRLARAARNVGIVDAARRVADQCLRWAA